MEIDRCPGCGAKVRPQSSWCSLCYQDLRPASELVTASATQADASDALAAPLVEASLEPEPAHWSNAAADDIVDADVVGEVVGEEGRVISPRDGHHDVDLNVDLNADLEGDGQPSKLATLTWICKCSETVSFEHNACPVCGGSFLGDLRDGEGGRHRPGSAALSWLPETRQVRLAAAAFLAMALAVLIPVIISLVG